VANASLSSTESLSIFVTQKYKHVSFGLQHKVTPTSIIFSPDGKLFATMATDGKVSHTLIIVPGSNWSILGQSF